jgi:hypothetical protein
LREAHRQLEAQRWQDPEPVPRSRADRLRLRGPVPGGRGGRGSPRQQGL